MKSDEFLPLAGVDDIMPKTLMKREVLSLLSKIYDPSGLVSPIVTPLKIIVLDGMRKLSMNFEAGLGVNTVATIIHKSVASCPH